MIKQAGGARRGRAPYIAAAGVFAVGMAGTTLPTPLYGLYREQIGFSELIVTVVFAVYAIGVIAALLIAGDFSDVLGRRPVLLSALGLSVLSAVCFLFQNGLPLLFAGRLLSGFSAGLLSGAATAAVLELAPPGLRARAAFAATAANMGGLGCGPLLSGILAQYAPWPLRLPFLVHIVLLMAALAVTGALPETVARRTPRPPLHPQGMVVPPPARAAFVPAGLAAFAGFSLLGLFTAVAPGFLAQTLGVHNLAVIGAVVFSVFGSSTVGQLLTGRMGARRALPAGCLLMTAGMAVVATSLLTESLPVLVVGAMVGGLGQGMSFRAGLAAVSAVAPDEHRGATISAFFVVAYVGISVPVVGVGALSLALGLRNAEILFALYVVLMSATVGVFLLRRPPRAG